jgi:hypothetical protein
MRTMIASSALVAAALVAAPTVAVAQTPMGDGAFCLKSASGPTSCVYQTMAACELAKLTGTGDQCISKAQAGGTTGAGGGMAPMQPPGGGGGVQRPGPGEPQR